eukprot:scaffold36534_cov42-Phaeocystis_antarctica.AAC.1
MVAVRVVEPGEGGGAPRSFAMYTSSRPSRLRLDCWNMRVSMSRAAARDQLAERRLVGQRTLDADAAAVRQRACAATKVAVACLRLVGRRADDRGRQ